MRLLPALVLLSGSLFSGCAPLPPPDPVVTATWGGTNLNLPSIAQLMDSTGDKTLFSITDTSYILHVAVKITNPSDDTITFASWLCSYEYSFVVSDTVNFEIQQRCDCYINGPCDVSLPPHSSTDRFLMLRWKHPKFEYPLSPIRIGLNNYGTILWSNELHFDRLEKAIYPN